MEMHSQECWLPADNGACVAAMTLKSQKMRPKFFQDFQSSNQHGTVVKLPFFKKRAFYGHGFRSGGMFLPAESLFLLVIFATSPFVCSKKQHVLVKTAICSSLQCMGSASTRMIGFLAPWLMRQSHHKYIYIYICVQSIAQGVLVTTKKK